MDKLSKSQQRLSRITEAAVEVFSRKGYQNSAVDDIAIESQTSKGGIYFYFPNKQAIFLSLLDRMAAMLMSRAREAIASEPDMRRKGDVALLTMLQTFSSHRTLARLFLVEARGAGREFNDKITNIHHDFSGLIKDYLDEAIVTKTIAPLDTEIASSAWFGAVNEVVVRWLVSGQPEKLLEVYPALCQLLRRGIGLYNNQEAELTDGTNL